MRTENAPKAYKRPRINAAIRFGILIVLVALVTVPLYTASSSSSPGNGDKGANSEGARQKELANYGRSISAHGELAEALKRLPLFSSLTWAPQSPSPSIVTFDVGCVNQQSNYVLGDNVCARVTGGATFPRRLTFVDPSGFIRQVTSITSDPQDISFQIPATQTSMVGNDTVDNRGTWRVNMISSRSSIVTSTQFVVSDPAHASADLSVSKLVSAANETVAAGSSSAFQIYVTNNGPNSAQNVVLTDVVPANTTFGGMVQSSGPTFSCTLPAVGSTGTITCQRSSLARGDSAAFDFAYEVTAGTPNGTRITNTATISSDTEDPNSNDNSSTALATVGPTGGGDGGATCTVGCPDDITVQADTTQGGQDGAIVHFSPPSGNTECGPIVTNHCNDCFFPVGITTVSGSAATGDSCSFTVTVHALNSGNPTITCPPNKEANADSNCAATINLGQPTAAGNNVTVSVSRSDGAPMYDCDANGDNCTRKTTDLPFSAGVTTVTWVATTHDTPGPYQSPADEEAHRTGNAACQQTVTVNDVTPPTITATDQTATADANCQAPVPDYSNSASDNCSCASNDNSQDCVGQHRITVTQDPAAGTMVGLGPHTIHLTANDGSSNNGGAGNTTQKDITFTVEDKTAPTITCPANVTTSTEPGTCSAHVTPGTATATDNCDSNPTVTGTRSDGKPLTDPYPGGTTTITWTATDAAGNHSSCTQTVTVNDIENPTISCPASITTGTDPNSCSATVNPGSPTASDNCGSPTVVGVRSDGEALNAPYPKGTTTIIWTATDSSGNHSSCSQTITVNDTQPPAISCTTDIIADFDPAVNGAVVTYTAPVGTDNCPGATTTQIAGLPSGSTFPTGTTTNTFKVTDASGNTAQCSFKVTVALTSLIGLDSVSITGSGYADSYSSAGGYPATKGSLANVLSNGTITVAGSGKVFGNVRSTRVGVSLTGSAQVTGNATAGTTVSKGPSAIVGGTITNNALAPVMTLPSVPACGPPYSPNSGISGTYSYNLSTGDLTLSGINIATLANGNYCFHNVSLTNSAQLKVNGLVTIKLTGTLSVGGASSLNNTTQIPSNFRILSSYSGSNGVTFGNSAAVYLLLYAPNTSVTDSGSAPLFGTVAGKTLTLSNSGAIHYDTQLKSVWPDVWTLIFGP